MALPLPDPSADLPVEVARRGVYQLLLTRHADHESLEVRDGAGAVTLSLQLTERGPVLRIEGAALVLQVSGELALEAEHLRLHGTRSVSLTAGGDLQLEAAGDLSSRARIQHIEATLGDVHVRANDDVRLDGERVRVNC